MDQKVDQLHLIESGYVKYVLFSETGETQTVCYLGEGFFFGEIPYFYGGKNAAFAVEAVTRSNPLPGGES